MSYTVGQIVKIPYWFNWVDGKVVAVSPNHKIKVDFEGLTNTYQDYELDRIQDEYRTKIKG